MADENEESLSNDVGQVTESSPSEEPIGETNETTESTVESTADTTETNNDNSGESVDNSNSKVTQDATQTETIEVQGEQDKSEENPVESSQESNENTEQKNEEESSVPEKNVTETDDNEAESSENVEIEKSSDSIEAPSVSPEIEDVNTSKQAEEEEAEATAKIAEEEAAAKKAEEEAAAEKAEEEAAAEKKKLEEEAEAAAKIAEEEAAAKKAEEEAAAKKAEEEAAAEKKKLEEEAEAAAKKAEEEAATAKKAEEEEAAEKKKLEDEAEAAAKKAEEDAAAKKAEEDAAAKKAEEDAAAKKAEEEAAAKKSEEVAAAKKAEEEAAAKKAEEVAAAKKAEEVAAAKKAEEVAAAKKAEEEAAAEKKKLEEEAEAAAKKAEEEVKKTETSKVAVEKLSKTEANPPSKDEKVIEMEKVSEEKITKPTHKTKTNIRLQFKALMAKSSMNQLRSWKTNMCQVLIPLFMIGYLALIIWAIDLVLNDENEFSVAGVDHPDAFPSFHYLSNEQALIDCPDNLVFVGPILENIPFSSAGPDDFATTIPPNSDALLTAFPGTSFSPGFGAFCYTNPTGVIPTWVDETNVQGLNTEFYDSEENKVTYMGGLAVNSLDFTGNDFDFTVYYNKTLAGGSDVPSFQTYLFKGLIGQTSSGSSNVSHVTFKNFPTDSFEFSSDLINSIGPMIYILIMMLMMPPIVQSIVFEKENRLREIMIMMGLEMNVYWVVTFVFGFVFYLISMIYMYFFSIGGLKVPFGNFIILLAGIVAVVMSIRIFRKSEDKIREFSFVLLGFLLLFVVLGDYNINIKFLSNTSPVVIWLFLVIWGIDIIMSAFLFSTIFSKAKTGTVASYLYVVLVATVSATLFDVYLKDPESGFWTLLLVHIFPLGTINEALSILNNNVAYNGAGVQFSNMVETGFLRVLLIFIAQIVVSFIFFIYFENVLPTGFGVKKHPLFFLGIKKKSKIKDLKGLHRENKNAHESVFKMEKYSESSKSEEVALKVDNLTKVYHGEDADLVALDKVSFAVNKNQCVGFLGPNGAGKSTAISILAGLIEPTSGTATVGGFKIESEMKSIHMNMGVCAQDDLLWNDLTGEEHLKFFGRLKGLDGKALNSAVAQGLEEVSLSDDGMRLAGGYSGGMKRRLSVACALIGSPEIVLLDECTTGLDPHSRNNLWKVILEKKKSTTLILTTHSMEEAEVLCDQIFIQVSGHIKTVGSPSQLKTRHSNGYSVSITFDDKEKTIALMKKISPDFEIQNSMNCTINIGFPKTVKVSSLFEILNKEASNNGILDWAVTSADLEHAFLSIVAANRD